MRAETNPRGKRSEPPESSSSRLLAALSPRVVKVELILVAGFSVSWLLAVLAAFGILPLRGALDLDLYRYYSLAAVLGWISGNVYLIRKRALPGEGGWKKRLLLAYLLEPPGVLFLLRAMAPLDIQKAAPLVPIYSLAIYVIFFLVPVTLKNPERG